MAQLDNAADSDSEERGFESLWAGQKKAATLAVGASFYFSKGFEPVVHLAEVCVAVSPHLPLAKFIIILYNNNIISINS